MTTTTTTTAPRSATLASASETHREIYRIVREVDGALLPGSWCLASSKFFHGFDRLDAGQANWLFQWLMVQIQTAVLMLATHTENDDSAALALDYLGSYRDMYLDCYGSENGFLRLVLRTADTLRLDNDVYLALLYHAQSFINWGSDQKQ